MSGQLFCAALCLAFCLNGSLLSTARAAAVDLTFFHVSDLHYLADPTLNTNQSNWVNRLNSLPGTTYPGSTNSVAVPWGVIASGDLIDAAGDRAAQWTNFVADFGLTGLDGRLHYPVYEGYGNHDQDTWLAQVTNRIWTRTLTRPGVVNQSTNGIHYSWNWGPVHFIMANIRVGPGPNRYNPLNSLGFVQSDLALQVGSSGRPVIIIFHIPATTGDTNEWPAADKDSFYQAIKDYNVIALLWGHTHRFELGQWNNIPYVQTDNLADSMTVFRITDNKMVIAQRLANSWGTVQTNTISMPVTPPRITNVQCQENSGLQLEVTGDNCLTYSIWGSSDLSVWNCLYRTNSLVMPIRFTDQEALTPALPQRFYRASVGQ